MNFETLYQKYKDGTATEEERAFVESEIEKARKVSAFLDEEAHDAPVLNDISPETIKEAKKSFNYRTTIRTIVITICSVAMLAVVALGAIFGTAYFSANNAKILTQEEAVNAAKALLLEITGIEANEQIVRETDMDLEIGRSLTNSVFFYEIEIVCGEYEYQVDVSSKTGYAVISDRESIDRHDRPKGR